MTLNGEASTRRQRAAHPPPPHDLMAEAGVLGALLTPEEDPARVYAEIGGALRAAHFYSRANANIYEAIEGIFARHGAVDTVTVGHWLDEHGRLRETGGAAYLANIWNCSPAVAHVGDHAAIVVECWKRRELTRLVDETGNEVRAGRRPDDVVRDLRAHMERLVGPVRDLPTPSVIVDLWKPFDAALLGATPAQRRWLLRHPTRGGNPCHAGDGDGLLPAGKVGAILAEGGLGKTMVSVSLAVSLATGRRWLGHFDVDPAAREGKILLGLAEEDAEEVHRRFYQAAKLYELDSDERARVAAQIVVLPLAGFPVSLVTYAANGRTLVDSPHLAAMRAKLISDAGDHGWTLVLLDPLARWAGPDVESDNSAATRFVQTLEGLTTVHGKPFVLLNHHSSKLARRTGSVDARGVTAITDAMRWTFEMRADGADVFVRQAKSNYSIPMPDELRLVRGSGGLLHVPTEAEQRARDERKNEKDAEKDDRTEAKITTLMAAIVDELRGAKAPLTSREQLTGLVRGAQGLKEAAVTRLLAAGRIRKAEATRKGEKSAFEVTG